MRDGNAPGDKGSAEIGARESERAGSDPSPTRGGVLALLIALTSVGQIGFNLPLSSLPVIAQSLGVGMDRAPLVLSSYIAGLAAGFILSGPLADRFGRRPVLGWGLTTFIVAGFGSVVAWNETALLSIRFVQGVGAASAVVIGRAVVRDLYDGAALTRATARITMAMAIVPGIAPILGSTLTSLVGWRWALAFGGVLGAALLTVATAMLAETHAPDREMAPRQAVRTYLSLLRDRAFIASAASSALALSALYAFFAGAPIVLVIPGGLTTVQFSFVPIATALPYVLGGWLLTRIADDETRRCRLEAAAWCSMTLGCGTMLGLGFADGLAVLGVVAGTGLYSLGLGVILPIRSSDAVRPFPGHAGVAGALLGGLQMTGGALAGTVVSATGTSPDLSFPSTMLLCVIGSFAASRMRSTQ